MTTRTFKQLGIAYGSQPANVTAKLNNVVVYEGPVTTLNEPFPDLPNTDFAVTNEIFTWTANVDFSGNQEITLTIDNSAELLVTQLKANFTPVANGNATISSGANVFVGFPTEQFGNTYVNGVLQEVVHTPELEGQWWWQIPASGEFIENVTIEPGLE
jgi:hypothetical protein